MRALFHSLEISDIRRETEDSISIAFHVAKADVEHFQFTPGQYLTLRSIIRGEEVRRSYSICSGLDDGELRIGVRLVPDGAFSPYAHKALKAGDLLDVMAPAGRFAAGIEEAAHGAGHCLAFAAGSGITPILSLIKAYLSRHAQSRFTLVYGNRTSRTIMFKAALEDLKDRFIGRLSVHNVLSREKQDVSLLHGRIDTAKTAAFLRLSGGASQISAAFLCGPYEMMETVKNALILEGVSADKIRREVFSTGEVASAAIRCKRQTETVDLGKLSIRLDGITQGLTIAKGETVLNAAIRQGLDLPYSCQAGMCCTCRARLIEGEVDMIQNFSLEKWEMAAGFVLTCQSVPKTRSVSVDFDAV